MFFILVFNRHIGGLHSSTMGKDDRRHRREGLPETDQDLVDSIAAGEQAAFESVYRSHKDQLLTSTVFMLRGQHVAAEDVLHDVFLRFVEQSSTLRLKSSLRNYLLACCLNRARDYLRREQLHQSSINSCQPLKTISTDPSSTLEMAEQRQQLTELINRLSDDQREVITLHLHGELTFEEVAQVCDISVNTAKSRYRYGIAKLQEWGSAFHIESGEQK